MARATRDTAPPPPDPWLSAADGLLIKPARGASVSSARAAVTGLAQAEAAVGRPVGGGYQRIDLDAELTVEELEAIAEQLVADGIAAVAEPNYRVVPHAVPNDPGYPLQWHLHNRLPGGGSAYGIDVEAAWELTTGSEDVVVAVLDTGSLDHPDIVGRYTDGWDMIADSIRARDGDGRDPDPTDEGTYWDGSGCEEPNNTNSSWHGLHVAGTIGASTNNGEGVAGVDQQARIQHVRVLGRCGGTIDDVADGIRWAAGEMVPDVPVANPTPARVINLSLGGAGTCPDAIQDAVTAAVDRGAVVVASAGNAAATAAGFPANCDGAISVVATSHLGDRAYYSNHRVGVDIAAPGGDFSFEDLGAQGGVLSTHNGGSQQHDPSDWTYAYMQGTSMAAPHVSGVVALMYSVNAELTPAEVSTILADTAQAFPSSDWPEFECFSDPTHDQYCGAGIVDAGAAVAAAHDAAVLGRPRLTAQTPLDNTIELTWDPVIGAGGSVEYRLRRSTPPICSSASPVIYEGDDLGFVDTGLPHGTTYRYCVTAHEGPHRSALSASMSATAVDTTPPDAPALGASNGDLRVTLSWNPVPDPTPPVSYTLHRSTGGSCSTSSPAIWSGTSTSRVDTGVVHGTTYRYCMTAKDGAGNVSARSNVRTVTAKDTSAPAAPSLSAKAGLDQVALSWGAVSDPTTPITYRLYRSTGSTCSTSSTRIHQGTGRSFTDTNVAGGRTYRYCMTATDAAGNTSSRSAVRTVTPTACYALAGDWDGSGRSGQGWWCDGDVRLRTARGRIHEFTYGRAGDVPVVADWNGDGRDTVSVIRDGRWHLNNNLRGGVADRVFTYGRVSRGDLPIAGDWDRRGRSLPGVIRDTTWHLRGSQSGGSSTWRFRYGRLSDGDLPLWGDWNGDGRDTPGIVRSGRWHLRNSLSGGTSHISFTYGRVLAGDRPVVGDWTGDGRDTPGIVRDGRWHLRYTNRGGGADRTIDLPPPGA